MTVRFERSPSVQLADVIMKTFAEQSEENLYRACDCVRKRLAYAYKKRTRAVKAESGCVICEKCGFCVTCGKCKTLGCGAGNSFESILKRMDERKAILKDRSEKI